MKYYQNQLVKLEVFAEQSENCEILMGKINLSVKKKTLPMKLLLELKGNYRVWNILKKDEQNSTESNIDLSDTINQLENVVTRRMNKSHEICEQLEREECFLEGAQKISQKSEQKQIESQGVVVYPFIFNIPQNSPPSLNNFWYANKRIQIKYFLIVKGTQNGEKSKEHIFQKSFQIIIRQSTVLRKSDIKFCKTIKYRCFTPFFCNCLGTYHIQLSANILHAGQMQLQGRVFREGKKTQKLINALSITLMGELKGSKKMVITKKKMSLQQNQYQMLEGEVILSYDQNLRTFESELITTRFWIECEPQFIIKLWKFIKQSTSSDIII